MSLEHKLANFLGEVSAAGHQHRHESTTLFPDQRENRMYIFFNYPGTTGNEREGHAAVISRTEVSGTVVFLHLAFGGWYYPGSEPARAFEDAFLDFSSHHAYLATLLDKGFLLMQSHVPDASFSVFQDLYRATDAALRACALHSSRYAQNRQ
jgi:hypothetical protein